MIIKKKANSFKFCEDTLKTYLIKFMFVRITLTEVFGIRHHMCILLCLLFDITGLSEKNKNHRGHGGLCTKIFFPP